MAKFAEDIFQRHVCWVGTKQDQSYDTLPDGPGNPVPVCREVAAVAGHQNAKA